MTPAIQQRKLNASMTSTIVIQKDPQLHKNFSVSMINIFNIIDLFKRYLVNSPTYFIFVLMIQAVWLLLLYY